MKSKNSTGRIASPLRKALPLVLVLGLAMGGFSSVFAEDRNRNGKEDWHEKGFYGKTPCEQATIIRDVGSTGAMVSGVTGFGPGTIIFGGIGLWGQMMVWSAC